MLMSLKVDLKALTRFRLTWHTIALLRGNPAAYQDLGVKQVTDDVQVHMASVPGVLRTQNKLIKVNIAQKYKKIIAL